MDRKDDGVGATKFFTQEQIKTFKDRILPRMEGKTKKQQNPYRVASLPWVAWIIARLGGWSGYITQSKPGYDTFKAGMDKFNLICEYS